MKTKLLIITLAISLAANGLFVWRWQVERLTAAQTRAANVDLIKLSMEASKFHNEIFAQYNDIVATYAEAAETIGRYKQAVQDRDAALAALNKETRRGAAELKAR